MPTSTEKFALVFALEGDAKPHSIDVPSGADLRSIIDEIRRQTGRQDIVELLWEDVDEAIDDGVAIIERLERDFTLIHATSGGKIAVDIRYERETKAHSFRPSATIRRVIAWAISPEGFNLVGEPAEFQIKHLDELAFQLGYAEQTTFGRAFRRWTGMSPGEFRRHARRSTSLS